MKQVWSWWKDNFRQCPGSWLIEGIFTLWTLKDNPSWHVSASLPLVPGDVIHILEYACLFVRDQKTPHHKFMHQWSQIVYTLWIYINHKYYLLNTLHRSIGPRGSSGTRLLAGPSGLLEFIFHALWAFKLCDPHWWPLHYITWHGQTKYRVNTIIRANNITWHDQLTMPKGITP